MNRGWTDAERLADQQRIELEGYDAVPLGDAVREALEKIVVRAELAATTESPIETMLGAELFLAIRDHDTFSCVPQYKWPPYRIDWAILAHGEPIAFIECDGKEWHSSPDQIRRDNARDEAARKAKILVFRFTGSEIYRNANKCALTVFQRLRNRCR